MHRVLSSGLAVAVTVVAVAAGVVVSRTQPDLRPALAQALADVPAATLTANFTDWSQVRGLLGSDVTSRSRAPDQAGMLRRAYDTDLSSVSSLSDSAVAMARPFGWSVLDASWEMFAKSRAGSVTVVSLDRSSNMSAIVGSLRTLGYRSPSANPDNGGVWTGGVGLLARISDTLSPQLGSVAVLSSRHLLVVSDDAAYAERTVRVMTAGSSSLAGSASAVATSVPMYGDAVAVVHRDQRGCQVTSLRAASVQDRRAGALREGRAGGVKPFTGLGFGLRRTGGRVDLQVVMRFGSVADAVGQQRVRSRLLTGQAFGQGGTFDERFTPVTTSVAGVDLVFDLRPRAGNPMLLSDLGTGPLLFADCGGRTG